MNSIKIKGYIINYKEVNSKYNVVVYDNIGKVGSFTIDKESFFKKIEIINNMEYYQIRNYVYTLEGIYKDPLESDSEEEFNLLKSPLDLRHSNLEPLDEFESFKELTNDKFKYNINLFTNIIGISVWVLIILALIWGYFISIKCLIMLL